MSNPPVDGCVSRQELREYFAGWVESSRESAIEQHLADCESCESLAEQLDQEPDSLVGLIRRRAAGAATADSAETEFDPVKEVEEILSKAGTGIGVDAAVDSSSQLRPEVLPAEIAGYEFLEPLGAGGMGSVFLARHRELNKRVAIKLIHLSKANELASIVRFQREIQAAGGLDHPAIVRATDAGRQDATQYLVMEYVDGLDLSRLLRRVGPLSIADACAIIRTVAIGLAEAHAKGIVHRDVKPSNIMISRNAEVKILDFGLARLSKWEASAAELTTVGQLMGTLDYMAPEQAESPTAVDYRADLYSLGATLFRLLAGRAPLAAMPDLSPLAKLRMLAVADAPRIDSVRTDVDIQLADLIASLLSRNAAERPSSALHVADSLKPFAVESDLQRLVERGLAVEDPEESVSVASTGAIEVALPQGITGIGKDAQHGRKRVHPLWLIATGVLVPLLALAGVLLKLELDKGQLVIDSEVAGVTVELLRDGEQVDTLQVVPGTTTTRIRAGKYEVRLQAASDEVSLSEDTLLIRKGETTIARIQRQGLSESTAVDSKDRGKQPVYDNKTLDEWIEVLHTERSSTQVKNAIVAIGSLSTPDTRERVQEELIGWLDEFARTRWAAHPNLFYDNVQTVFNVLRTSMRDEDAVAFLTQKFSEHSEQSQLFYLKNGVFPTDIRYPAMSEYLHHVLESSESGDELRQAVKLYVANTLATYGHDAATVVKALEFAESVGKDGDELLLVKNYLGDTAPYLVKEAVLRRAREVVISDESSLNNVVHACRTLSFSLSAELTFDGSTIEGVDANQLRNLVNSFPEDEQLNNAIKRRMVDLAGRTTFSELTGELPSWWDKRSASPWPADFQNIFTTTDRYGRHRPLALVEFVEPGPSFQYSIELLQLMQLLGTRDECAEELETLRLATEEEGKRVQNAIAQVGVVRLDQNYSVVRLESRLVSQLPFLPTEEQWVKLAIWLRVKEALQAIQASKLSVPSEDQ